MQQLASYLSGAWQTGRGRARTIHHAITGAALWEVTSEGLDMAQARRFAIERGGKALQAMTFIERSAMLKAVAKRLLEQKDEFYAISAQTGATRADSWVDIEGGIGTLFTYAGLGSRELPDDILWPEDELIPLSKQGGLPRACADIKIRRRHPYQRLQLPLLGNAGKTGADLACACRRSLTGNRYRPAHPAMVKAIVDSGLVPEGAI
ncbi:enoyl-CoA hydratase, partial [Klebsiella aerogenes]